MAEDNKVSTVHPDYAIIKPDWDLVRDAINGETEVKKKSDIYCPMPSGFTKQTDGGQAMYAQYILRGKFPEIFAPTLRGMVGIIHRVEADIELPPDMEYIREKATLDGLPLAALHERITFELLATGRYGILVDAPSEGDGLPYFATYKAETIINWSLDQDFYVLDETHLERDGFEWKEAPQYRILELLGEVNGSGQGQSYQQRVFETDATGSLQETQPFVPQLKGGNKFTEIPFVVVGSTDIGPDLDEIPLVGVARCAFNMYRLDTDYKWQLFMSGQETLFVYTDSDKVVDVVGAGVVISLPIGGSAQYVGPAGKGIEAHKNAIADERFQAVVAGARIFDTEKKAQESGEALKMRWTAQTASLTTIALNSSKGLERSLKNLALMLGSDPEKVSVKANLKFIDQVLDPLKAKAIVEMWQSGAISGETMWENFQKGDIASYDKTWEEELQLIEAEIPDLPAPVPTGKPVPNVTGNSGGGQPPPTGQDGNVPQNPNAGRTRA